jgi:hypothetical protein
MQYRIIPTLGSGMTILTTKPIVANLVLLSQFGCAAQGASDV